jgi:hypothetical protein
MTSSSEVSLSMGSRKEKLPQPGPPAQGTHVSFVPWKLMNGTARVSGQSSVLIGGVEKGG